MALHACRSYYRCTRSAEQGCAAKRTVQRNDDDGGGAAAAPEYTVVYVSEHTCTANDSLEAPVILETTTTVVAPSNSAATANTTTYTDSIVVPTMSDHGSCSTITITTGTESPAISGDDITCWSSTSGGASSSDYNYADDDYYYDCGGLFGAAVHGGGWATGPADASSSSSLLEMEDMNGPIRSPVHVPAVGWTIIDQLLLQLVNEPAVCHF